MFIYALYEGVDRIEITLLSRKKKNPVAFIGRPVCLCSSSAEFPLKIFVKAMWMVEKISDKGVDNNMWDKVFKNEPSKLCGRLPLKHLKAVKFFKGCPPQIWLVHF